jgi:acyl-coenzyme A synthetase/AMP-(fatty) acid ligase
MTENSAPTPERVSGGRMPAIATTSDHVAFHANDTPDRIAVENAGESISYRRLHAMLRRTTVALSAYGIAPGSLVAVMVDDKLLSLVMLLACENLGLVTCSMVHDEGESARRVVARASLLIADRAVNWGDVAHFLLLDAAWRDRVREARVEDYPRVRVRVSITAPARVRRSSGTTGTIKMMLATRRAEEYRSNNDLLLMGMTSESRYWPTLGFSVGSVFTQTQLCLRLGATLVISRAVKGTVHEVIRRKRITHLRLFQPELKDTLEHIPAGWEKPPGLTLIMGAAPITRAFWDEAMEKLATRIVYTYNTNESGPIASMTPEGLGTVRPGVTLEVVDDEDRVLPWGEEGNIRLKTPAVVPGYLDDPVASAEVFRGGWFYPNDIGVLEGPGRLRLVDRKQNVLNVGGRKFSPAAYSAAVNGMPFVREAFVTSALNPDGVSVCVVLMVTSGEASDGEIAAQLRRIRAPQLGPISVQRVPSIPRTANGKVSLVAARALYDAARCFQVGSV